ncbi:dihydrofolate reductase family protein [Microbacterium indicum]|uniref:dihydrofolate reductase family protein n=1 Tax=Microbacterium indicum TaxID=358100 RepID=UPI00040E655E|nr:dihydrofolate reductase family protein [Microbacterium indicum]
MTVHYYTSSSLDGFIATADHSLEWLFRQDFDQDGPMNHTTFIEGMGALVMGSSTYEWLREAEDEWPYSHPTFVLTTRELAAPPGADVRLVRGDVSDSFDAVREAAAQSDIWVVGGGDVAGQFADAGLLDEVWVQFAPVMLGSGRPVLPREIDLELVDVARNRAFACARYRVVPSAAAAAG